MKYNVVKIPIPSEAELQDILNDLDGTLVSLTVSNDELIIVFTTES